MPEFSNYLESRTPVVTADGTELVGVSKDGEAASMTTQQIADLGGGGSGTVESVTGTGVNNADPDNPIIELANGLEVADTTGTAIAFAIPQTYGSVATPETGNITLNATGLVKGMVQLCLHNSAIAPTFGAEFFKIGGNYQSSQLNSIYFHAVSATRIEYTINQTS